MEETKFSVDASLSKCVNGKEAYMVCISKNCQQSAFVCTDDGCSCSRKVHYCCSYVRFGNLIERVDKKRLIHDDKFNRFCEQVNGIYEQVIERASKERQKFDQWKQYAGLSVQQKELLEYVQKEELKSVMMNLGKNWDYMIKDSEYLKHEWKLKRDKLEPIWKELEELYLKNLNFYSTITNDIANIQSLFDKKINNFSLLYRATSHNFSIAQFHRACDGEKGTLTLIKPKNGKSMGIFTTLPWMNSHEGIWLKQKNTTFSFCLETKRKELEDGIYCKNELGPVFSSGTDIILYQKTEKDGFELPRTYGNRHYCLYTSKAVQQSKKEIEVIEWEVFKVNWNIS